MPNTLVDLPDLAPPAEADSDWFIEWSDTPLSLRLHTHPKGNVEAAIGELIPRCELAHWYVDCIGVDAEGWDIWLLEHEA